MALKMKKNLAFLWPAMKGQQGVLMAVWFTCSAVMLTIPLAAALGWVTA
jgi:hypothetical protein